MRNWAWLISQTGRASHRRSGFITIEAESDPVTLIRKPSERASGLSLALEGWAVSRLRLAMDLIVVSATIAPKMTVPKPMIRKRCPDHTGFALAS